MAGEVSIENDAPGFLLSCFHHYKGRINKNKKDV